MSILKIKIAPDRTLNYVSDEVSDDEFGGELNSLASDMIETMEYNGGIGLAAIQVGVRKRVLVANIDGEIITVINPVIISSSEDCSSMREGCLSVPSMLESIERPSAISVKYRNLDGGHEEGSFFGDSSHIIQHEIDHLDGKTILNKISRLKRDVYTRKVKKIRRKLAKFL